MALEIDFGALQQPFANRMVINRKTYLYFGGTAYLGMPKNKLFINLFSQGIKKYGLNNGTSRNNNIQLNIYNEAEKVAAKRFGADDALITSSGYLAAQLAVKHFANYGEVIYAPVCHPALWVDVAPTSAASFKAWKAETIKCIQTSASKNWVIISNSMNNLLPEIFNFSFLKEIDEHQKITLIIDDSHGIGINQQGLGAYRAAPKQSNIRVVVVASMAKALGVDAGLVLADKETIKNLKNTAIFLGASPPAAAGLFAFVQAEVIYQQAWLKLQKNIKILVPHLNKNWQFEPGFPAFFNCNLQLANQLLKQKILISSFPYPGKNDPLINRLVISSWHEEADLNALILALKKLDETHLLR